ncbi:MAG: AmmeMemoRadiSam system radical SAM enzyme [Oscillospiraceae bacterium]|nr:AmmeMemoRadiSam system radical SAM enzyme [Oscillospiraceae bacterium]
MVCDVCFRHCNIPEGGRGFCGVRTCKGGRIVSVNYGKVTSLALDPVEKKPLARFHPGKNVLSVGSFGCTLRCPFCHNHSISWDDEARLYEYTADVYTPEELADIAEDCKDRGNIGIAFTYNEPLAGYEFVRDTAREVKKRGMLCVLVTSGNAQLDILEETAPYIDAMNIDLKGFTDSFYKKIGGDLGTVTRFIERAVQLCHVEITTLVIPGENDSEGEIREISRFIAGLKDSRGNTIGKDVAYHISRFFPRFHMQDRAATDVRLIYRLADIAREELRYVYTGNC